MTSRPAPSSSLRRLRSPVSGGRSAGGLLLASASSPPCSRCSAVTRRGEGRRRRPRRHGYALLDRSGSRPCRWLVGALRGGSRPAMARARGRWGRSRLASRSSATCPTSTRRRHRRAYEDGRRAAADGFYLETLGGALLLVAGGGLLLLTGAGAGRRPALGAGRSRSDAADEDWAREAFERVRGGARARRPPLDDPGRAARQVACARRSAVARSRVAEQGAVALAPHPDLEHRPGHRHAALPPCAVPRPTT